jgi:hypothetical protein
MLSKDREKVLAKFNELLETVRPMGVSTNIQRKTLLRFWSLLSNF